VTEVLPPRFKPQPLMTPLRATQSTIENGVLERKPKIPPDRGSPKGPP
jgi:hypothetical protein